MSKILLVEDDAKIRAILKEILQEKNHEVDEAGDGQEGLKKLEQGLYDLCICDIKMPKMDGLEVLDRVKEAGIATNFVVISAHGNIDRSEEHTSELQSLMRISYAVFCLKQKKNYNK